MDRTVVALEAVRARVSVGTDVEVRGEVDVRGRRTCDIRLAARRSGGSAELDGDLRRVARLAAVRRRNDRRRRAVPVAAEVLEVRGARRRQRATRLAVD